MFSCPLNLYIKICYHAGKIVISHKILLTYELNSPNMYSFVQKRKGGENCVLQECIEMFSLSEIFPTSTRAPSFMHSITGRWLTGRERWGPAQAPRFIHGGWVHVWPLSVSGKVLKSNVYSALSISVSTERHTFWISTPDLAERGGDRSKSVNAAGHLSQLIKFAHIWSNASEHVSPVRWCY